MDVIYGLHSLNRWLVVAVAVVAIVKFALGWLQQRSFTGMDRGLASGFAGLMDLQLVLGLVLLFGLGVNRVRTTHMGYGIVAVILAHLPALWRRSPDRIRFRNTLLAIVASVVVIIIGVSSLPQGWFG